MVTADLLDLDPDAFDRCERSGGHHPGRGAHEQQDQWHSDQQRGDQRGGRVVDLLQGGGDHDDVLLAAGPGVLGHHVGGVVSARKAC